ncbi:MauE/DoxX family redox-associated membrane protein [Leptospira sp. 'Mane']|uniref:MauE/DoxX family redox-associated membrane protein n=1 Tax=Leptospira sp. 'Mane' TaxID=3387407 RepID=UPI00398A6E97
MNIQDINGFQIASFVMRLAIGANLLAHGLVRMGNKYESFQIWIGNLFAPTILPNLLVKPMGYLIPPLELILGVTLLFGFQIKWSLTLASLLMCSLIFGMCLLEKWEIVGIQMVYMICYFLLLTNLPHQIFALDNLWGQNK